jgi:hypothetical protein
MLAVVVGGLWPWLGYKRKRPGEKLQFGLPLAVLLLALLAVPTEVILLFIRSKAAWFDRYGMLAMIPASFLPVFLLAWRTRTSRAAGTVTALILLGAIVVVGPPQEPRIFAVRVVSEIFPPRVGGRIIAYTFGFVSPQPVPLPHYLVDSAKVASEIRHLDRFHPDLPLVAASGLTFLEMDNREDENIAARLFFLTDAEASAEIAHANIFESMGELKKMFPIRGNVEPYELFTAQHPQFLVIGTYDYPEDWLLRKAEADGAKLRIIGRYYGGYKDSDVYQVTMPAKMAAFHGVPDLQRSRN